MTVKDKAVHLFTVYLDLAQTKDKAIKCAIIHVKGIIEVVKPDPYPRKKNKMDREYWQEVLTELKKI